MTVTYASWDECAADVSIHTAEIGPWHLGDADTMRLINEHHAERIGEAPLKMVTIDTITDPRGRGGDAWVFTGTWGDRPKVALLVWSMELNVEQLEAATLEAARQAGFGDEGE
jgi:hypothetical protein